MTSHVERDATLGHCLKLSEWVVSKDRSLIGHLPATCRPLKPTVSGGSRQKMTLLLCDFQCKPVVSGGKRQVTGK